MKNNNSIYINQVGYLPGDSKIAYISSQVRQSQEGTDLFELCDTATGKTLYSGKIQGSGNVDKGAGQAIYTADFSDFQTSGKYFIKFGQEKSFDFQISSDVYRDLYFSTLNYFKLSRCGQGLCHTSPADVYGTDQTKNVHGGWHDAGDYGRYVVAGAKTIMDLLLAYNSSKDSFKDFDILAEVRFELEWMLQMQREDGGVYHKITCYHFCGFVMPAQETERQVLSPVSTAATADFVGVTAYSAQYFEGTDPEFARKLIEAAKKSQAYLDSHEDEFFINPPEITTGAYGDRNVSDERYFALCSLWAALGDETYLNRALVIRAQQKDRPLDPNCPWDRGWVESFGWGMVAGYGTEILLANAEKIKNRALVNSLCADVLTQAMEILEISNNSAFGTCLLHFGWGSNGAVCDQAHVMMMAYSISKKEEFKKAAKKQIDYILGCNPLDLCYITCQGSRYPVNPHHRPSGASGKLMPGMLSGGPSEWLQDECAKENLQGQPPLKCFIDAQPSYSTNEVAIYWNSAFVYLLAKVFF